MAKYSRTGHHLSVKWSSMVWLGVSDEQRICQSWMCEKSKSTTFSNYKMVESGLTRCDWWTKDLSISKTRSPMTTSHCQCHQLSNSKTRFSTISSSQNANQDCWHRVISTLTSFSTFLSSFLYLCIESQPCNYKSVSVWRKQDNLWLQIRPGHTTMWYMCSN